MPIQNYQKYMKPILEFLNKDHEITLRDLYKNTAEYFKLSDEDLADIIPSGRKTRHHDRVGWAVTYLKQAGLVESPRRSYYSITERGREALQSGEEIDTDYLSQFAEFQEFRARARDGTKANDIITQNQNDTLINITPDEAISQAHKVIRTKLAGDLLDRISNLDPTLFEELVIDVIRAMGYGVNSQHTGRTGDKGIDGIINEDILGLDVIYLQAKRWERGRKVGIDAISSFIGSLDAKKATKGIFITTSDFSDDAKKQVAVSSKRVKLINGSELAEYMMDYGVGVSAHVTFIIQRIDENYFTDD